MSERTLERTTDEGSDSTEDLLDGAGTDPSEGTDGTSNGGLRARAARRSGETLRGTALALVSMAALWVGATAVLPGGSLAGLAGLLVVGFAFGLLGSRRYAELGVAGGTVAGGAALLDAFGIALLGAGLVVVAASAGVGLLVAVFGHYLGRDLRDGLQRDL